jgi:hypothetical protein
LNILTSTSIIHSLLFTFLLIQSIPFIERRVLVVNTPFFVFRRSRVQISIRTPAILTEVFRGFP